MKRQAIYKGKHPLTHHDIRTITELGTMLYEVHHERWDLTNTMHFISHFQDVLHVADWEQLFTVYQLEQLGAYVHPFGGIIRPTPDEEQELVHSIMNLAYSDRDLAESCDRFMTAIESFDTAFAKWNKQS